MIFWYDLHRLQMVTISSDYGTTGRNPMYNVPKDNLASKLTSRSPKIRPIFRIERHDS